MNIIDLLNNAFTNIFEFELDRVANKNTIEYIDAKNTFHYAIELLKKGYPADFDINDFGSKYSTIEEIPDYK